MLITLTTINFQNKTTQSHAKHRNTTYPKLSTLAYDTVSFEAMKRSEFEGIDLAVVKKFKAPIGKFNTNEDLQNWARDKAKAVAKKDFDGHQLNTKIQRQAILKDWSDYVFNENTTYTNTSALLILNAVTKDLKPDNDNIPPVLNKRVLADCISEIDKNIKNNPKYQFDLNKMYQHKLHAFYRDDIETDTGEAVTKWVVIPSKKHDPKNFETNIEKLKALSYKTWSTKSYNTEPYLAEGDFHIYIEKGNPKIGIRFVGDKICEILGKRDYNRISFDYFEIMQNHISKNKLKLTNNVKEEINLTKTTKKEIAKIKRDLKKAKKNNDIKTIYNYFGINVEEDQDGYLTLSKYKQPSRNITYKDLGIDENKLFKKVKIINGDGDFRDSNLTDLKQLRHINGNAYFGFSQFENLGNLEFIGINAYFDHSLVTNLGNLKIIGRNASFSFSQVTDLGKLEKIGNDANFNHSKVKTLGNLTMIGGNASFYDSQVTDLGKLKRIYGSTNFNYSKLIKLGNLEYIDQDADFGNSQIIDLGKLKVIGRCANIQNSQLTFEDFKNIKIGDIIIT